MRGTHGKADKIGANKLKNINQASPSTEIMPEKKKKLHHTNGRSTAWLIVTREHIIHNLITNRRNKLVNE